MTQFFGAIIPFAITGALVSAIVQFSKPYITKSGNKALLAVAVSIVGGIILWAFKFVPINWLETILSVWAAANTVYLAVIQWFEVPTQPSSQAPSSVNPVIPPANPQS